MSPFNHKHHCHRIFLLTLRLGAPLALCLSVYPTVHNFSRDIKQRKRRKKKPEKKIVKKMLKKTRRKRWQGWVMSSKVASNAITKDFLILIINLLSSITCEMILNMNRLIHFSSCFLCLCESFSHRLTHANRNRISNYEIKSSEKEEITANVFFVSAVRRASAPVSPSYLNRIMCWACPAKIISLKFDYFN